MYATTSRFGGRRHDSRIVLGFLLALVVGLVASGALVFKGTSAAFSGTTSNAANTWATGSVSLTSNDSSAAMFPVGTKLKSTDSGSACIKVTYTGDVTPTAVKFYTGAITQTSALASNLQLTIYKNSTDNVSTFGSACTGWQVGNQSQIWTGTLTALNTANNSWANGIDLSWTPAQNGWMAFKFVWSWTGSPAQGASAAVPFTWEAQA